MGKSGTWREIFLIWSFGLLAGASLGKVIPVIGLIMGAFGVTPGQAAWMVSVVALVTVIFAPQSSWLIDRIGDKRVITFGVLTSLIGNVAAVFAPSFAFLFAARVVESIGFTGLLLGGTAMTVRVTEEPRRNSALALWAACVPVGIAVAEVVASMAAHYGWRGPFIGHAVFLATALLATRWLPTWRGQISEGLQPGMFAIYRFATPIRLGLAITALVVCQFGGGTIFPTYLQSHGQSLAVAGTLGALATLCTVVGNALSGWMLNLGWRPVLIALLAVVLAAVCGAGAFLPQVSLISISALFGLCNLGAGLGIGLAFASIPNIAPDHTLHSASASLCNQMINLGFVIGPPIAFASLHAQSFDGPVVLMLGMGAAALLLLPRRALTRIG